MKALLGPRPPWWRPFARRRWHSAMAARFDIGIPVGEPAAERSPEWMHKLAERRSRARRDRLNAETDAECVDADVRNRTSLYAPQRAYRNRDGEQ